MRYPFQSNNIPVRTIASLILVLFFALTAVPVTAAPKTDVIVFHNGDRLTGEVKSLKRGVLHFNTDATGTIKIEWDKISSIVSNQHIQVETGSGARYFGSLVTTESDGQLTVSTLAGAQTLDNNRVILMTPIESGNVLSVLDVDVTLGFNFAKAGGVLQNMAGINVDYRTLDRIYSLTASTTTNDSDTQERSDRNQLGLEYKRLRSNRWYFSGILSLERNDELGLDLRTSVGGSIGRFFIQSNSMLLDANAGLQFSREKLFAQPGEVDSVEAVFAVVWDWFRFDSPELDWSVRAEVIPNLTDFGRVRSNFDTGLKWEVFSDLDLGISFYSRFDNQPQSVEGSKRDYGVNTTVTYEF